MNNINTETRITIHTDSAAFGDEGEQFAIWCMDRGYNVRASVGTDTLDAGPEVSQLWELYCRS